MHIGFYPQQAARPHGQTVRAAEKVTLYIAFGFCALIARVAGQQQMVPDEPVPGKCVFIFPTDDLPHGVVGARIGGVYTRVLVLTTVAVIGQRAIHPACFFIDGQPLGSVHFGGTERIAGLSSFYQHFALIGKTIGRGQRTLSMHHRQPAPGAVGIKTRHVQGAVVQQFAVGSSAACRYFVAADEFINVFKARILSRIHHRPPVTGLRHPGAFMRTASDGSAFDRRAVGVHGIDFHNPTKAVGLIRVPDRVEALVMHFPLVIAFGTHSPALMVLRRRVTGRKIIRPVFLAG